jgi:hypothetical protein
LGRGREALLVDTFHYIKHGIAYQNNGIDDIQRLLFTRKGQGGPLQSASSRLHLLVLTRLTAAFTPGGLSAFELMLLLALVPV